MNLLLNVEAMLIEALKKLDVTLLSLRELSLLLLLLRKLLLRLMLLKLKHNIEFLLINSHGSSKNMGVFV
jgi:hypothetical protein